MEQAVVGSRFGLSLGFGQLPVYASAAARTAVLEAEQVTRIAAGLLPADATTRPTRLAELLVTPDTGRARVHDVLRDVADARAQLLALEAAAIARLGELQPGQQSLPGARGDDPAGDRPDDWVADEVAVVLGISVGSASSLVEKARVLAGQLPRVWAAAADGVIDARRCQVLVNALAHRKRSAGGGLDDQVVDDVAAAALGWIGEGIGPTRLAERVGGALIAADPAEADRRAGRRKRRQNVTTVGAGDGLAGLRADLLDAADAEAMMAIVDAMAGVLRTGGDTRPIGALRVASLTQLLTRPWETLPEGVARACHHLRLRVDLADLDGLGALLTPPDDDVPQDTPEGHDPASAPGDDSPRDDTPEGHDPATAAGNDQAVADSTSTTRKSGAASRPIASDDSPHDGTCRENTRSDGTLGDHSPDDGDPEVDPTGARGDTTVPSDDLAATPCDEPTGPSGTTPLTNAPTGGSEVRPWRAEAGSGVGSIGGLPVPPVAVAELLARYDALTTTGPTSRVGGGEVWFEIVDSTGRLRALTSPAEARAAFRRGLGLGPPPAVDRYEPSAAQVRFVKARDRHCRFPGCIRAAEYVDLDHVIPYQPSRTSPTDAQRAPGGEEVVVPSAGGPTCVTNLVCLCRRHHRLKTHSPDWDFRMDPDGTLHVTPPGGRTRTTRPECIAEVDMSTPTHLDTLTDLLGPTPKRYCSPTPEQREQRRAVAADRARLAAEIDAELDAAFARLAAEDADGETAVQGDTGIGTGTGTATDAAEAEPPPF